MSSQDTGFVLSTMPFRETSLIVALLCERLGLVRGVVKGVNTSGRPAARMRSALQLGNVIEFNLSGKSSLKNLYNLDVVQAMPVMTPRAFVCLSYVNELLRYLLPEEEPVEEVFLLYRDLRVRLPVEQHEHLLRDFETCFLVLLGYGLEPGLDVNGQVIHDEQWYELQPGQGFVPVNAGGQGLFAGSDILAVQSGLLDTPRLLGISKRINRLLIDFYLEGKPLKSREMYKKLFVPDN